MSISKLDRDGMVAGEATCAVAVRFAAHGLQQPLDAEVAQRVCAHELPYLFDALVGGDELAIRRHVNSQVAGMLLDRRSAHAQVHLFGPCPLHQLDHVGRGGAADNAVVYHYNPLAGKHVGQRIELQLHSQVSHPLVRLNEGPAHVPVLGQALAVSEYRPPGHTPQRPLSRSPARQ